MEDVHRTDVGLFIRVFGIGEKERWCVINHAAEGALRQYLRDRNLPPLESCGKDIPLVSSTLDNTQPVGYQALHESFTAWMKNLIAVVGEHPISNNQPTLHKLRHTFATTAVKDGVPYDVIQAQLGHQDINTTISTYATAPDARRVAEINRMT
jgi:site-specific recombinase XerD